MSTFVYKEKQDEANNSSLQGDHLFSPWTKKNCHVCGKQFIWCQIQNKTRQIIQGK